MDTKIFYINGKEDQHWYRFQQCMSLMPHEITDIVEKINFAYEDDYDKLAKEFGLSIDPESLTFKLLFAQFPDLIGQYITHFAIYQKIIEDNLSGAFILESNICTSDLVTFLSLNPDLNENLDISNLASDKLENDSYSYFVTNHGAKKF